jgi:hypothetical protein
MAADGTLPIGTLGPYADTSWSQVCQDGLAWFGEAYQIPLDVADTSSLDLYNDEYGMPYEDATTFAQVQTEVVVRQKVRTWRVRAFAKRVRSSSNYYFLEYIVVHDITRSDREPLYLGAYKFEFDEFETTRSRLRQVIKQVPSHQLSMGAA